MWEQLASMVAAAREQSAWHDVADVLNSLAQLASGIGGLLGGAVAVTTARALSRQRSRRPPARRNPGRHDGPP